MSKKGKSYEVGYKKPPVATRFKKGKSGNPNGRRKKELQPLDPGTILESLDNEEIIVMIDGKRKRMTKAEIQSRQLFTKAIKGNLTAARLIVNMATKYFAPDERGNYGLEVIGAIEATQRYGRNWQRSVQEHNARLGVWR
jgi:Family of unknown function (DUF5681)